MADPAVRVLVAYDSRRGHVEQMAEHVAAGARRVAGAAVILKHVGDVTREDLLACDALALGSPVHTGTMSVPVKQFLDAWHFDFDFYPTWRMRDRVGAAFAAGGQDAGGREMTLLGILAAFLHHRMIVVSDGGPLGASASTETGPEPLGATALANAETLGHRLADTAAAFRRGRETAT